MISLHGGKLVNGILSENISAKTLGFPKKTEKKIQEGLVLYQNC